MITNPYPERTEADLEAELDLVLEQMQRVRMQYAIETYELTRVRMERDLKALAVRERELQEERMAFDGVRLHGALLRLDFSQQTMAFRQFVAERRVGAFLIHGAKDSGQRWLLNRLVREYSGNAKTIRLSCARKTRATDLESIWRELAGHVHLPSSIPAEQIVDQICEWWRTQHVLLIFDDVDYLPESSLVALVEEFWARLAEHALASSIDTMDNRLLLFLLDYEGIIGDSQLLRFADFRDPAWHPRMLIRLPRIANIPGSLIRSWIEISVDDLPHHITARIDELDELVNAILRHNSDAAAEDVLRSICEICHVDWYQRERAWIKL